MAAAMAALRASGPRLLGGHARCFSQFASGFSMPMPKKLDDIMPLALLQETESSEIAKLWNEYHLGRTHLGKVMTPADYLCFKERAQGCPMFVLPVPRPKGFVTMLTQVQSPHILVTGLEDFKVRGAAASPFLTATHYTELEETKGLVLVRGDVVLPSKLADTEASQLVENLHMFYVRDDLFKLVKDFNQRPQDFDFRAVTKAIGLPVQW